MVVIVEKDGIRYSVGDENSLTAFLDSGFVIVPEKKEELAQDKEAETAEKPTRKRTTRRKG